MDQIIDTNRKVNIDVKNQQVSAILDQLFLGTDNTYSINDRQITIYHIKANNQTANNKVTNLQSPVVITDAQGESMIGVSVKVKRNNIRRNLRYGWTIFHCVPNKNDISYSFFPGLRNRRNQD